MTIFEDEKPSWTQHIKNVFTLDGRSVAALRIATGLLVAIDALGRWPFLATFFSDSGTLTREDARESLRILYGDVDQLCWSLNFFSGELWLAQSLTILLAGFAVLLVVGFQTRIATAACWILLVSFHHRNPLLLTSGDTLLKLILFWGIFLPLGRFWSIDRWLAIKRNTLDQSAEVDPYSVFSAGTIGLIFQFVSLNFFEGLSKANDYWLSGDALGILSNDDSVFRTWIAAGQDSSFLLNFCSFIVVPLQLFVPFLLLVPMKSSLWRSINFVALGLVYSFLLVATNLWFHSFVYLSLLLVLVPGFLWEHSLFSWIRPVWKSESEENMAIVVRDTSFRDYSGGISIIQKTFCICLTFVLFGWNLSLRSEPLPVRLANRIEVSAEEFSEGQRYRPALALFCPAPIRWIVLSTATEQRFDHLGLPPEKIHWVTFNAKLKNGSQIDLLHLRPIVEDRPENLAQYEPSSYWRNFQAALTGNRFAFLRKRLSEYLTENWNSNNRPDKQISDLQIVCHSQALTGENPVEHSIWYDSASITNKPKQKSFMEMIRDQEGIQPFPK